jgi:hypothetical protein
LISNPTGSVCRARVSHLFGEAWAKAASVENCTSGFKATGLYPFNRHAIPEYMFSITDANHPLLPCLTPAVPSSSKASANPTKTSNPAEPKSLKEHLLLQKTKFKPLMI